MSQQDDLFSDVALPLQLELNGEEITITSPTGTASTVDATVGVETVVETGPKDGRRGVTYTRSVTIEDASVTTGWRVTIGSLVYEVEGTSGKRSGYQTLTLKREELVERARDRYRM